jgi:nucleoside-diphosphate-sugar epimerase
MKTLVLGGTGLIGRPVCEALASRGHDVTVLSRGTREAAYGTHVFNADRHDAAALSRALEGRSFDLTVDLLAYDGAQVSQLFAIRGFAPGRVVMISTGQVYLVTDRPPPYREGDFDAPVIAEPEPDTRAWHNWKYGVAKREAEAALRREAAKRGIEAMALRVPVVHGEADATSTQRLWAWIERILDGGPVLLPDNGEQRLRFAYAKDIANAIATLGERASWEGVAALNIAQPNECTLRSFVERVAACTGRTPEWVPVAGEALDQAGIPRGFVPFWGRYFSRPDPTTAIERFGLHLTDEDVWLPSVVRAHLGHEAAGRPPHSHEGYAHRPAELALASRLTSVRPRS